VNFARNLARFADEILEAQVVTRIPNAHLLADPDFMWPRIELEFWSFGLSTSTRLSARVFLNSQKLQNQIADRIREKLHPSATTQGKSWRWLKWLSTWTGQFHINEIQHQTNVKHFSAKQDLTFFVSGTIWAP
jgi:hypothetical protein